MTTQTLNELANTLLTSIESEKAAELSKTASLAHTPVMETELGQEMVKVATALRALAVSDITNEDVAAFRRAHAL